MNRFEKIWFLSGIGALLYWLSLPPMQLPWAAFLASALWVGIIARECPPTRGEYWQIWMAGAIMWLALLQGIRLAFWPLYLGWIALALYVAVYLPLFIAMGRSLHHRWRFPLPVAAATAWVGCELIRAYFATGFAACMLAHSQTPWPWMLPIASQFGSYGVSYVVMFMGALIYQWATWAYARRYGLPWVRGNGSLLANISFSVFALAVVLGFATYLQSYERWIAEQEPIKPLGRIALIQENMPTQFDSDFQDAELGWQRYEQQTSIVAQTTRSSGVDLVVWPESTFSRGVPWFDWDSSGVPKEFGESDRQFAQRYESIQGNHRYKLSRLYEPFEGKPPYFLVGTDAYKIRAKSLSRFNTALWLDPSKLGEAEYYGKQHLVMFGEYIPVVSWFPEILARFGMGVLAAGEDVPSWQLPSGAVISTTICFEDVLPHVVRARIAKQSANGKSPDLLVNITNDGWFRGSSILDHHLNNAILAAVENRRPMLIAANLGISAWIDSNGRVVRSIPRLEAGFILTEPKPDGRWGLWQSVGDWPARLLAIVSLFPILLGLAKGFLKTRPLSN